MANLLSYTTYEFEDIVLELQNRLKETGSWADLYRSSTGETLIELMAYVLNVGMYYLERRAQEVYMPTAHNRSSIINLASLVNYSPRRTTSAVGNFTFSIDNPTSKIIFIPKYTSCQNSAGTKFLVNSDGAIQKGQSSVTLPGIQGELVTIETTSNGTEDQEILINSTTVENSADESNPTLRVHVDGIEWTKVSSFLESDSSSTHYRVVNQLDDTVKVVFGDGINGYIPDNNSTITVTYVDSDGVDGVVAITGDITTINDTIYDEDGTEVDLTLTNSSAFLGGEGVETTEEIRYNAPQAFQTGDRGVTAADMVVILKDIGGIADANVWGEYEEATMAGEDADATMINTVRMSVILQDWVLPDTAFKQTIVDTIYSRAILGIKYEFVDPSVIYVVPTLWVKVNNGYSLSQTQSDIEGVLADMFELGITTKIGSIVKYSTIMKALQDLDGVSYVNMDLEVYKNIPAITNPYYGYGAALDMTDVKPGTAKLYIDDEYVTTDYDLLTGGGEITASGDYTVDGTINYSTGIVLLNITPTPTSVYIRYQQDETGNLVPSFNEICNLYEVDVVSIETVES